MSAAARSAASLVIALCLLASPAVGRASQDGQLPSEIAARLPGWVAPRAEQAMGRTSDLRRALWEGSLAEGLAAVLSSTGVEPAHLPTPAPRNLADAVLEASARLGRVPKERFLHDLATAKGPDFRPVEAPLGAEDFGGARPTTFDRPVVAGSPDSVSPETATLALRILSAVDLLLETSIPPSVDRSLGAVDGCDVLNQLPYLCIGGSMDNRYTQDAALLIDQGGNDEYLNSAGGAPFLPPGGDEAISVSVNVDLGTGDDRYITAKYVESTAGTSTIRTVIGQGAAISDAIGLAVDQGGDDVYSSPSPPTSPGLTRTQTLVQGAAWGIPDLPATGVKLFGVGALLDLGGSDRYEALGPEDPEVTGWVRGQAMTDMGASLLLDLGQEDDRYVLDALTAEAEPQDGAIISQRYGYGQGFGLLGPAVLADDGGGDSFLITGSARRLGRTAYAGSGAPRADLAGQGMGWSGLGVLLEGVGATEYRIVGRIDGFGSGQLDGQGSSVVGGSGILDDLGGNDRYTVSAAQELQSELVVDDSCKTTVDEGGQARCPFAKVVVDGYRPLITVSMKVQGSADIGTAVLRDHAGNDVYQAISEARLHVEVTDRLTEPTRAPDVDALGFDTPMSWVQGSGGNAGVGLMVDDAGTDSYTARSRNETSVRVTSEHAQDEPDAVASSRMSDLWVVQQGAGNLFLGAYGGLFDLGGSGDTFLAEGSDHVGTWPDPDGAFSVEEAWPSQQGNEHGALVALGDAPSIVSVPSAPTCSQDSGGVRGFGAWGDCTNADSDLTWASAGGGTAPRAAGVEPVFAFTPTTVQEAPLEPLAEYTSLGARIPAEVRVTLPDGSPVEGAPVNLRLEYLCGPTSPTQLPGSWAGAWSENVLSGSDGVARARIPLLYTGFWEESFPACDFSWRIQATYSGRSGVHPAHATSPLTLT